MMTAFPALHSGITLALAGPVARVLMGPETILGDWGDTFRDWIVPKDQTSLAVPSIQMALFGEELTLALNSGVSKFCPQVLDPMSHLKAAESTVRHLFKYEDVQIAASRLASKLMAHVRGNQHSMSTRNIVGVLQDCIGNPRQFGQTAIGPWLWWQPLVTDAHRQLDEPDRRIAL